MVWLLVSAISMLSGAIIYYIPLSRAYLHKGCHMFIDTVAFGLKAAINTLDIENSAATRPAAASLPRDLRHESERDKRQHRRNRNREKNRIDYKEANERNGEWSTVQLYPGRGFAAQSETDSLVGMKWNKELTRFNDDDILYTDNYTTPQNYQLSRNIGDAIQSSRKSKHDDTYFKKKKSQPSSQVFHQESAEKDDEEAQRLNEKLRKLRRRIHSMVSVPDKDYREKKEVLKLIEDLLKNSNDKVEYKNQYPSIDDESELINVNNSRSDRKFTSSTRKKSSGRNVHDQVELPDLELEGLAVDSDYYLQTPIINDRVTPILRNTFQWLFGGCPSGSHKRR